MNFRLRNLSIPRLIGALIFFLSLVSFVVIGTIFNTLTNQGVEIDVSGRNRMLSQRMVLFANLYLQGDKSAKKICLEAAELHDLSVQAMKFGGQAPAMEEGKIMTAATGEASAYLKRVENFWEKYQENIYIILEEPLYVDSLIPEKNLLSNRPDTLKANKAQVFNPKIRQSIDFLNANATRMLQLNNDLVRAYVKQSKQNQKSIEFFLITCLITIIILLAISLYILRIHAFIPIRKIIEGAEKILAGQYKEKLTLLGNNEFGRLAQVLNLLFEKLRKAQAFVDDIGAGRLNTQIPEMQHNLYYQNDPLLLALLNAQEQLQEAEKINQQRNWANEGMTQLDGILRENTELQTMSSKFLRALVHYIQAEQGAIFLREQDLYESEIEFLVMKASYAYQREKHLDKKIPFGKGIISEIVLEGETQIFKDLPENYLLFQTGMGEAKPPFLLLVPIKTRENTIGVIELASFRNFEPYIIQFVEKLGENLGITLTNLIKNETMQDLYENAQKMTEELRAQEEELRQNMEELAATQEELVYKEKIYLKKIELLESKQNS